MMKGKINRKQAIIVRKVMRQVLKKYNHRIVEGQMQHFEESNRNVINWNQVTEQNQNRSALDLLPTVKFTVYVIRPRKQVF